MRVILKEPRRIVPLCITALFFFIVYISAYPCVGKIAAYPVYREFKKQSFILSTHRFNIQEGERFRIFYRDASKECVDMVLNNAEKSLNAIMKDFDYVSSGKIDIIIYPDYKEMAHKIGLGAGSTAMGVYYGGIISILEPQKWINRNYNIRDVFTREGPILHELTHYVVDYQTNGNVPVWFTEGVALYEEYRMNDVEWGAGKWYEIYYSPEQLDREFYDLDEAKAYKQSFLIVKCIADNYGIESIHDVIKGLSTGKSLDKVFKYRLKLNTVDIFRKACHIKG